MKEPKVLVAAPTYDIMRYCNESFLNSLKSLNYQNYDILLIENSKTDEFFDELKKLDGITAIKHSPNSDSETNLEKVVNSRNKILQYALEKGYDYLLMMDSDVILPSNSIKELISCDKDIVSGIYYNHFNAKPKLKWLPVCWKLLTEKEFEELKQKIRLPDHLKEAKENFPRHLTEDEVKSGKLMEVYHPSAGCMLLSKSVFSKLEYGVKYKDGKLKEADDIYFIRKAREKGFSIWCNTKILCEHLVKGKYEKDEKGNLLHPMHK